VTVVETQRCEVSTQDIRIAEDGGEVVSVPVGELGDTVVGDRVGRCIRIVEERRKSFGANSSANRASRPASAASISVRSAGVAPLVPRLAALLDALMVVLCPDAFDLLLSHAASHLRQRWHVTVSVRGVMMGQFPPPPQTGSP